MRLRTVAVVVLLLLAGAISQAGLPTPINLLQRSEKAETRLGRTSLHEGKYQGLRWGARDKQVLANWSLHLSPYVQP